jgi:hypothetical protein
MNSSTNSSSKGLSYRDAGVDIDAGDDLVDRIKPLAKKTMREGVLAGIGGFGALFEVPKHYKEPVLVSGTDGVGTKLRLAFEWNRHDTIGVKLTTRWYGGCSFWNPCLSSRVLVRVVAKRLIYALFPNCLATA